MNLPNPEMLALLEACRSHARDLLKSAEMLAAERTFNVGYHLATLALEEIGKSQLIGMRSFAASEPSEWFSKQLEDHVKKLFWALWGPTLTRRRPDRNEIESLRNLASTIHENRLRGLYVSSDTKDFIPPRDAISQETFEVLVNVVRSRLLIESTINFSEPEPDVIALLQWFSAVTDDAERRRFIFSAQSFDKLESAGDSRIWMQWLREEFGKAEQLALKAMEAELGRPEPEESEAQKDKWQIKIRLHSQSHSIRQKALNEWNTKVQWITLFSVDGKKDQMLVEFRLPARFPVQAIWSAGFGFANTLILALNIGTTGFFWWNMPSHLSKFYEKLRD